MEISEAPNVCNVQNVWNITCEDFTCVVGGLMCDTSRTCGTDRTCGM